MWGPLTAGAAAAFLVVLIAAAITGRRGVSVADRPGALPAAAGLPGGRPPPRALVGAGSCTSSGCHAAPVGGHAPWQSSYTVWVARDPHARAHAVLHEPLATAIVAALAAGSPGRAAVPAAENVACIGCHATGRGHRAAEGVGCESCHGPAGDWLVPHALPGWRTAGNQLGMIDLADPFVVAGQCAGCHVGGPPADDGAPREVSHDLIAAGHPRLAFELRSFKEAEPPHWRDRFAAPAEPSSAATPRPFDPVDEWALGRLAALHTFVGQLERQVTAADRQARGAQVAAVWPEFTAFDCYACHRPALVNATGAVRSGPIGKPRLEPLQWALLDVIAPADAGGAVLATFRDDVEHHWCRPPDAAALAACLRALDAVRARGHASLAALPAGPLADRIVAGVNPADWDEAAAALAALRAVADRARTRGATPAALATARERHNELRRLLEFPAGIQGGRSSRFDSPRDYDADAVGAAVTAAAAALADLP